MTLQTASVTFVLVKQPTLVKGFHRMTKVESGTGLVPVSREECWCMVHKLVGAEGGGWGWGRRFGSRSPVQKLADRVGGLPSSRGSRGPSDSLRKEPKEAKASKSQSQRTQ